MAPVIRAEVTLVSLKNCLVNLPPNIIALLSNSNTAPQNVVVELQYRSQTLSSGAVSSANGTSFQRSAFVGWTGMPSRTRTASLLNDRRGGRDQEIQAVEVDATFAKLLGLSDGSKVGLLVHLDPPVAHTVHIEPLTPADWEVIELHATFLELNLLSQIRALPNPTCKNPTQTQAEQIHPLTLHLSPNTNANIIVTSLAPTLSGTSPFAKIAPDAEVIVAPKTRARAQRSNKDARSTASRVSGKSATSGRSTSKRGQVVKQSIFLRGLDAGLAQKDSFGEQDGYQNEGLKIWLTKHCISSETIKSASFASVTVVKPAGLRAQLDQSQIERLKEEENAEAGRPATKIVARIVPWTSAINDQHAICSSELCYMLGVPDMSGLILRVQAAEPPLPRNSLRPFIFSPFLPTTSRKKEGLRFGGDSKVQKQAIIDRLRITHGGEDGLLSGPITDGMILPPSGDPSSSSSFDGGVIRFSKIQELENSNDKHHLWVLGGEQKQDFDVRNEVPRPMELTTLFPTFANDLPAVTPSLIGIEPVLKQSMSNLTLCSSILLTGGIGSGKTAVVQWLGNQLRDDYSFNVIYYSCQKLVTDETRVSVIKETLTRLFMSASWCARLGGQSVVILDDLDKICPVETELQVGNDNGRSRQVTEILCAVVRQYCSIHSGVALLATAQSKDNLNSIIIGGHIVGDIISLKAPSKETRRDIIVGLLAADKVNMQQNGDYTHSRNPSEPQSVDGNSWMDPSNPSSRPGSSSSSHLDTFRLSPSLDLLDVAGKTDGYMPADLRLLVSRARNECLIRSMTSPTDQDSTNFSLILSKIDFESALKNFTPTSLRNVTLTHSTTTFSEVGGLKATRDTLLETLLYPTKYAPIFAASPLRLRSGLLLYGFPGCGKTLLASAVAGECGLNFISVKGPEILNKYIGASEKSVRDLFERAQAAKPCVLFFDEFDSIAPKRGHDSTGVTDRVVNQMLTQMDGAEGLDGVYVLAATSRPDLIDPALLRPGRLDKSLLCDMPDCDDREDILRAVSDKLHLTPEVSSRLSDIAVRSEGFSGADLQALMYNAHLEAIHDLLDDQSNTSNKDKKSTTNDVQVNGTRPSSSHSTNRSTSSRNRTSKSESKKPDDFIQFIYDPNLDAQARDPTLIPGTTQLPTLSSRAMIAAKLSELKQARKLQKSQLRGSFLSNTSSSASQNENENETTTEKENGSDVLINWSHVEKSLATTRSSISAAERRRLEGIYREFVVGRNGEMPNGDGGREVGGRSSLM